MKLKMIWKIIITLITIITTIYILKNITFRNNNDNDNNINTISLTNYPFYKKENHNRYLSYQKKTNLDDKKTILYVNIGLDNEFYTKIKESNYLNTNYLIVNKYNYLSPNYIPNDLVKLNEFSKNNLYLNKEAYNAFKKMAIDAKIQNLNIRIISAYRSYEYQENLYNNYLKKDSRKNVDTYSARPGHSEHQTALAIDIDNIKSSYENFDSTEEFNWIINNCYKYGFILRYPKDKEHITGYMYEPWHYRYVGTDISVYIYNNNLTYEEYYYEFID